MRYATLYADDNPMEEWLAHCAFGTDAYKGKGTRINAEGQKVSFDYADWQQAADSGNATSEEIAAVIPLIVGYAAEAKWTDKRHMIGNTDYPQCQREQMQRQPQGFDLKITVPPFKKGKIVMQLSFFDNISRGGNFFDGQLRSASSYLETTTAKGQTGSGPQPVCHTWGIGIGDLPPNATKAIARLWFDPYGDGRYLLPNTHGLELIVYKGSAVNVGSV